ncbi:hypothetical protein AXX17_AT5G47440 [Arabidopsis thaliana]|jgi:Leucine-rich repeat (LRR) protein|uniref:Uncharacterized protein n=2 Tax=Arabidopsis thaliana TaxID=3702 RepID=A0A178UJA5_ARATH|nr:hypothetical protein AXX17_AT5G47440 [Arabidopsis thaliana]
MSPTPSKLSFLLYDIQSLLELRMLDVTGSKNLTKLPDLSRATKLEELIAKGCTRLEQIPETIGSLPSLKKLDVSHCDRLINLQMIIGELPALQKRSPGLFRQASLSFPDAVVTLNSLTSLAIHGKLNFWLSHLRGKADHLCFSSEQWTPNKFLKQVQKTPKLMSEFYGFKSLDIMQFIYRKDSASFQCYSFSDFLWLTELNLINLNIESIPDDIGLLQVLQKLDLSGNDFTCLPTDMENLSSMKSLRLCNCLKLQTLPKLPQLETLKLSNCILLQSPLGHSAARKDERGYRLAELWLDNCNDVFELSYTFSHCTNLTYLDLSGNDMVTMPVTIRFLRLLNTLCLNDCKKLKSMVQLPPNLTSLYARGCTSLEIIHLPLDHSIKHVDLSYCPKLNEVANLMDRFLRCGRKEEVNFLPLCFSLAQFIHRFQFHIFSFIFDLNRCLSVLLAYLEVECPSTSTIKQGNIPEKSAYPQYGMPLSLWVLMPVS